MSYGVEGGDMRIVDLSHELSPSFIDDRSKLSQVDLRSVFCHLFKPDPTVEWQIAHLISSSSHVGTHLESPYHWTKEGRDIASLPLESLIGPAVKLDISHMKRGEAATLEDAEKASKGRLRGVTWSSYRQTIAGCGKLRNTGWIVHACPWKPRSG